MTIPSSWPPAGAFVAGASIELSVDGPMRPPYVAYLQGALTYAHGKLALRHALNTMAAQHLLGCWISTPSICMF
jgi:hypothetical protein